MLLRNLRQRVSVPAALACLWSYAPSFVVVRACIRRRLAHLAQMLFRGGVPACTDRSQPGGLTVAVSVALAGVLVPDSLGLLAQGTPLTGQGNATGLEQQVDAGMAKAGSFLEMIRNVLIGLAVFCLVFLGGQTLFTGRLNYQWLFKVGGAMLLFILCGVLVEFFIPSTDYDMPDGMF